VGYTGWCWADLGRKVGCAAEQADWAELLKKVSWAAGTSWIGPKQEGKPWGGKGNFCKFQRNSNK
jgi:hypothetical protein